VQLHPISCGKNWGYGDRCAVSDGQVIVDLGRMNRIVEVNSRLAYAVVEPGVTQGQMYQYLVENDIPLVLDVTGAGPDASIVGNTLSRGFGHTPYGNHFTHTCGLEVVLPDGQVLNTGFGTFDRAQARRVFPWGLGPVVDGLFSQSNRGIVTQMGFWLLPTPESIQAFAFTVPREAQIEPVVDAIRELRLAGTHGADDDWLARLVGLSDLEFLNLTDLPITGQGLQHLAGLKQLKTLGLGGTQVNDDLAALEGLPIERLDLRNVPVTDKAVEHVKKLKSLKDIWIDANRWSAAAQQKLKKVLPQCAIHIGTTS